MRSLLAALVVVVGASCSLMTTDVQAASDRLVITQVQTGGSGSGTASQEFISLFNNSSQDIDVSNWCVRVSDYNDAGSDVYCFTVSPGMDEVQVPAKGAVLISSPSYPVPVGVSITGVFTSAVTMSATRGHVTLLDAERSVVDRVAWDNKASVPPKYPETLATTAPAGGSMITRVANGGSYSDTDNNEVDFVTAPSAPLSAVPLIDYKKQPEVVDICPTVAGLQTSLPEGYGYDVAGNCELISNDVCTNIDRIQMEVPAGYSEVEGGCYDSLLDVCQNIDGFQLGLPVEYRKLASGDCKRIVPPVSLHITEVMPNAVGTDTGHEYIEIYNPTPQDVDLSDYILMIGKNAEKSYELGTMTMPGGSYLSITDVMLGYSLLNTTTRVELRFYDSQLIDEIVPYQSPSDDMSWSLIDGVWQYSDMLTPGAANQPAAKDEPRSEGVTTDTSLAPCPAGKYRSPLTNRCRTIESDAAVLASCDADEFRNPETNRCRKISLASVTLAPCNEGYERNPETNRCRKLANDDGLTPCEDGYVRNPATNRCKKALSDIPSKAADAVKETTKTAEQMNPYVVAAVAGLGVVGYGFYEWRTELASVARRGFRFIVRK